MPISRILRFLSPPSEPLRLAGGRAGIVSLSDLHAPHRGDNEAVIRNLCQVAYLGDHMALCRVLGRYKMYVDTRDVGLASHLMLEGFWEMWVTQAILALVEQGVLREGMVVADIGANLGYFTLLLADLVGPTGRVHAFEPNPHLAALLGKSVHVNGYLPRADVHPLALSDSGEHDVALVVPPGDPKNAHMVPLEDNLPEHAVRVPCARLDSRLDWRDIEFAKIDVEGAEELVWAGMQGLLDNGRLKTVILEFTPGRYADASVFLNALLAPGFSLARIDYAAGIVPVTPAQVLASDPHHDIMLVLRR